METGEKPHPCIWVDPAAAELFEKLSVANLLSSSLICFLFQKTTMLGRCIAAEVNSAGITASLSPLPWGSAGSSVHGIELSDLAQWAFNQALWRSPTFAHLPALHTKAFQKSSRTSLQTVFGMSNSSYGKPYASDRYSTQRRTACDL